MSRNLTRVNTSQRKQEAASEREAEANDIENEITMLTKSHQETRDRLKSLKATKSDLRKRKSSSKAESNSSGRVRTATSSLAKTGKTAKVALAAKISSKKSTSQFFFIVHLHPFVDDDTSHQPQSSRRKTCH
jgi:chromosome segregation ATPase